jgi:hypothetical protein
MHALIINVAISDLAAAAEELRSDVIPTVRGAPGFVAAYWVARSGTKGTSLLVFDDEASAEAFRDNGQRAPGPVTLESIESGSVCAQA